MPRLKVVLAAIGLLGVSLEMDAAAVPPVSFFGRQVRPLLSLISKISVDDSESWTLRQAFVFKDGTVLVASLGERFDQSLPFGGNVASGLAEVGAMPALNSALVTAHIASLGDCFLDPPDSPEDWEYIVTWYGSGTRKNTFRVTDGGLPHCPETVATLREAIERVIKSATRVPTTLLRTPPPAAAAP